MNISNPVSTLALQTRGGWAAAVQPSSSIPNAFVPSPRYRTQSPQLLFDVPFLVRTWAARQTPGNARHVHRTVGSIRATNLANISLCVFTVASAFSPHFALASMSGYDGIRSTRSRALASQHIQQWVVHVVACRRLLYPDFFNIVLSSTLPLLLPT